MMREYVRFDDDTQVSCSDVREDSTVLVVIERPRDWGFDTDEFVHNKAPLIMRFAYEGGRQYT